MRKSWLVIAGLLAFLAGALSSFPARVAYAWFAPPDVELAGIKGTLWNGSADHANVAGVYLSRLEWQLSPLSLLLGRLSLDAKAEPAQGFIEGSFSVTPGGKLSVKDLVGSLSLASLTSVINMGSLSGTANVNFSRVVVEDGFPRDAEGKVEVANLFAAAIYPASSIGGYVADFSTTDAGIVASVEDTDGIVDLAGSLTLSPDRNYQFLGVIAPKPDTDDTLRQQMRFLGSPNSRGQYDIRLEGAL